MIVPVKYVIPSTFGRVLTFFGEGALHVLETGLVLEGLLPRIRVPVLLTAYHQLFCGHTIRTVPYSVIETYRASSLLTWHHLLVFWLPVDGHPRRHSVGFRLKDGAQGGELARRLGEYTALAKTLGRS